MAKTYRLLNESIAAFHTSGGQIFLTVVPSACTTSEWAGAAALDQAAAARTTAANRPCLERENDGNGNVEDGEDKSDEENRRG